MFPIGSRVVHEKYGPGLVVHVENRGAQTHLLRMDDTSGKWNGHDNPRLLPVDPYDPAIDDMVGLWWCHPEKLSGGELKEDYEVDEG